MTPRLSLRKSWHLTLGLNAALTRDIKSNPWQNLKKLPVTQPESETGYFFTANMVENPTRTNQNQIHNQPEPIFLQKSKY